MMPSDSAIFLLGLQPPTSCVWYYFRGSQLSFPTLQVKFFNMSRKHSHLEDDADATIAIADSSSALFRAFSRCWRTWIRYSNSGGDTSSRIKPLVISGFPVSSNVGQSIHHPPPTMRVTLSVVWLLATRHGFTPMRVTILFTRKFIHLVTITHIGSSRMVEKC